MKLEILKDILGNNYIGIDVTNHSTTSNCLYIISKYLELNINIEESIQNVLKRNNNKYHITVFNVAECNKNNDLFNLIDLDIADIKFDGIGMVSKDNMHVIFIVIVSKQLNKLRESYGFNNKDLHVTLAFTHKDLFNVSKKIPNLYK